jgi:hypothetical protein
MNIDPVILKLKGEGQHAETYPDTFFFSQTCFTSPKEKRQTGKNLALTFERSHTLSDAEEVISSCADTTRAF